MTDSGYSGGAIQVADKQKRTKIIEEFAKEHNMRVVDFNKENLVKFGVTYDMIKRIMPVIVDKLLEFYGVKLRELQRGDGVKEKYGITDAHFRMIIENSNIGVAYAQYVRQYVGDDKTDALGDKVGLSNSSNIENMIPKQQITPDIKGAEKVYEGMRQKERENLESLIKIETDPKKKELYETQLKLLNLKLEQENG